MNFTMPNIAPALPEIFILSMACLILVVDLFLQDRQRVVTYLLTQLTLIVAFILVVTHLYAIPWRISSRPASSSPAP